MKAEGLRKVTVVVSVEEGVFHYTGYVLVGDLAITVAADPSRVHDGHYAILERLKPSADYPGCYEFAGDQSLEIENCDDEFRECLAAAPDAITALALFNDYQAKQETSAGAEAA